MTPVALVAATCLGRGRRPRSRRASLRRAGRPALAAADFAGGRILAVVVAVDVAVDVAMALVVADWSPHTRCRGRHCGARRGASPLLWAGAEVEACFSEAGWPPALTAVDFAGGLILAVVLVVAVMVAVAVAAALAVAGRSPHTRRR